MFLESEKILKLSRRNFLLSIIAVPSAFLGSTFTKNALKATPAIPDDDETPSATEGPFYTPNSPYRTSFIETGIEGTKIILSGLVLSMKGKPLAKTLVDLWHCDNSGDYDNEGYKLRGHQFTDDEGKYQFETIVPGLYPGRTRHYHVKIKARSKSLLTTQLFFPNEPRNKNDYIFLPELLMDVKDTEEGKIANFNFVLDAD
ncbi:MAG: intradiol ring-cleavage dioxygenase [Ignavibacteria bacterium]